MASNRRVEIKRGIGRREVVRIKTKRIKKGRERDREYVLNYNINEG